MPRYEQKYLIIGMSGEKYWHYSELDNPEVFRRYIQDNIFINVATVTDNSEMTLRTKSIESYMAAGKAYEIKF